jgi:hypothetical protein
LELIVSKLPRNGVTSATQHLRALLGEYSEQHSSEFLTPVRIVAGDDRNPVDYVFVSVHPSVTQDPRPDLLETIRLVLVSVYGLQAAWKIGRGPDRTRRVHLQSKVEPPLRRVNPYQCSFVSKMLNRITYDLLDRPSVDKLFKNPPVIDHLTFHPSVPRYIQPVYGLTNSRIGFSHSDLTPTQFVQTFGFEATMRHGTIGITD